MAYHQCESCEEICYCDCDDMPRKPPILCDHECEEVSEEDMPTKVVHEDEER